MLLARQLFIKYFTFLLLTLTLLCSQQAMAGGVRVIQNPDFEIRRDGTPVTIPTPSGDTWYYWGDNSCLASGRTFNSCIAGWRTTDTGQYVEVGYASTYGGFGAQNNRIVAELNASSQSRLYQPICLQAGEVVTMNYYFSARLNAGGDPQQVAAGLWNINDTGPIGGAISSQNSNFSLQSTAAFAPQTAVFSAPADGLYQIGLEAVLPSTGSNGNLIDDIRVVLKPLIDLNTAPRFTMPEGTSGNSLQLRVNGTVQTPTVVALRKISGSASSDLDFTLGTPVGLAGTTPTISHVANSDLWLVTIPAGEYDAGQGIFGNAKYGVQIPVQSSYDVLREGTEPLIFELQTPSADGSDPLNKWDRTNPICEGPSTNQVEAEIIEVLPVIKVNKNLIGRVNAADQFTTVIKDSLGNVVSSTASSLTTGGGVTTTGVTTGLFTATGKFEADFDQTYTISEVMAAGSANTLSAYTSSISCTNARVLGAATTLPSGVGQSFTIAPQDSDDISCTITNAPLPIITVNKALASTRAAANDQFTVQIKNGLSVVNAVTNSTSTGAASTITGGTGTTGATILPPSISYTLTEVGAGSPVADLSLYNTFISCSNTYGASSTVLPSGNGQSFNITPQGNDNITCTLTNIAHQPRLILQKALTTSGRLNAADQFIVQVNQGVSPLASGTTAGAGSAVTGGVAGPIFLGAGVNYTLTEVMAGGSVSALSAYDTRISCTNTNGSSSTVLPSGSGTSFSLTPQLDDVISCTLTNGNPRIRVNKTVTTVRNGTDRFTTQIRTSGAAGPVVSNATNGGGTLTTAGVGSYTAGGYYLAKSGTTYTVTEMMTSGTLSQYSASISCTNATVGSSTVLPTGTASSFDITPQFNDDITCTLTNITHPVIAFNKALTSARLANTDQFLMRVQGGVTNVTTTTTGTGSTVANGTIAATQVVAGTNYTLSETTSGTTNLVNYNSRITCTNSYGASSTVLPTGAGTSFVVTPQLGDNVSCTLTNGREPRLKLNKTIATGLVDSSDRFTTEIRESTGSRLLLSSTSNNPLTGGAVTTTGGVGTYNASGTLMVAAGTTYNLTEVISAGTSGKTQYDTTISCTNNGVAMGAPTGSGQLFAITPATGDNINCTLTNSPKSPRITLNKRISGVVDNITPVDTFKTQIYNGATLVSDGNTAAGTALTNNTNITTFPQSYSAVTAFTGSAGTTYTLTEAIVTGSTLLANYSTFIDCVNTRSDGPFTTLPDGAGQSFNLTVKHGDNITCTLDNGPAQIVLKKALANNRLADANEFTMQIRNASATVLNSTVSSTTAGQDDVVTSGSGTTDITYVPANGSNVYTLIEVASGGTTMTDYETRIDCTNAKVGSLTVLPSTPVSTFNATQSYTVTPVVGDAITCTMTNKRTAPRIRITKALGGPRYVAADQFSLQVRDAPNTNTLASTTTTGAGSTVASIVNYTATVGTTYTIREIIAAGSSSTLADYISSYSCINNATGVTTTGATSSLSFTAAKYDDLECTFTNTPRPRIKVNKTVNASLIDVADRFTTQIRTGGVSGTVVSGTGSGATADGGVVTGAIATFPSTATATGTYQAAAGTALTITEAITAGTSILSQYYTEISCVNANTSSSTVLPSGSTPPFTFTPQNGDSITCALTNTPLPRLQVSKVVASIADATDRFTTQIRTGGVSGTVVSGTSNNAITGGGVLTTGGVATYTAAGRYQALVGTTYTFTEILSAGASDISQYSNTFSCSNSYAASTTPLPTGAYPYELTPQLGDNISCSFTNNVVAPKIRVQKTVVGLADIDDRFITQIRTGGVSGTVVSNPNSSATVGGGVFTTGGAGTYPTLGIYAATVGTTYTFTEVFAAGTSAFSQYTTSISCINARTAGSATTLPSGSTAPFNLTPKAGDDITCTLSNDVIQPKIKVNKIVSSLVDANDRFTTQVRTGGVSGTVVSNTSASTTLGGGVLTSGGVATYNATGNYQGVLGTTYTLTEVLTAGSSNLAFQYNTSVSCTNARVGGPTTVLPTGSTQPFNIAARAGDDITCTLTNAVRQPKLRIHKTVSSLVDVNDLFTTEIRLVADNSLQSGTTASTTTGGGVLTTGGVATFNATGSFQGIASTPYNLTESISVGTSALSQYTTSIACTNAFASSATVLPTGQVQPFNVTTNYGDDISCTLTNSIKQPTIRVHKTVSSLVDANDRFTTQVRTGGVSGAVVSNTTSSLTLGGGVVTTGGLTTDNATGSYQAVIGTTYTLTEAISAGTSALSQYNASMSCSNARLTGIATTLPTGLTQPFNIVPKAGDDISCTLTNSIKQPLVRVHKTVSSLVDPNDRFTTEIRNGAAVVSGTGGSTTLDGGVLTTGGAATYNATGSYQATIGTSYSLTESISVGTSALSQYNSSISCSNARVTGLATTLPSGSGQSFVLTTKAGDDISCTLTNSIKQPIIRVNKVVLSLINSADRFTTEVRTGGVSGTVVSMTSSSATLGGGVISGGVAAAYLASGSYQAAIGTTYTLTEIISTGTSLLSQYAASIDCSNARTTGLATALPSGSTQPFDVVPKAGDDITCRITNAANTYSLQGKVFLDNGKGIATPHNGTQETGELGIGNITMTLTDCAATTYQTVLTDGAGAYSFAIPNSLTTGATLCVEEHQPSTLVSVTGVVGTSAGSYSLASDRTQFTLTINTNYTAVNFGDVAESQLTGTGSQTISAGTTANYVHQFIAGTEGVVTLTTAQAPSPSILGWTSLMYLDATCDAQLNAGDTQITAPISVVADQLVCLIQKVQSPVTATNGAMDISTVSASFAFAAPSVIVRGYSQPDTTIIMDTSLVLIKRVREVSSCPSTGADVNPFTTNNQALPNALIEYQIIYSNPSASTLSNISIRDMTPAFTTYRSATCAVTPSSLLCASPSVGSSTAPSVGGVGDIDWILTDNPTGLGAGQSGEVRFCVQISP